MVSTVHGNRKMAWISRDTTRIGGLHGPVVDYALGSVAEATVNERMDMGQATHDVASAVVNPSDRTMPQLSDETKKEMEAFMLAAGLDEGWADDWKRA